MKSFARFSMIACLALFATACGTTRTSQRSEALAPASADQTAYLLATIGVKTSGDNKAHSVLNRLRYRRIGTNDAGMLEFSCNDLFPSPVAFKTSQTKGGVAVAALQPGTYEIYNVEFYFNNGMSEKTVSAKNDFSIPFTLKAGEALYLGEFIAETAWGRNFFGLPIPAGGYFKRTDNRKRDLPLLRAADANLASSRVIYADVHAQAQPFVIARGREVMASQ